MQCCKLCFLPPCKLNTRSIPAATGAGNVQASALPQKRPTSYIASARPQATLHRSNAQEPNARTARICSPPENEHDTVPCTSENWVHLSVFVSCCLLCQV